MAESSEVNAGLFKLPPELRHYNYSLVVLHEPSDGIIAPVKDDKLIRAQDAIAKGIVEESGAALSMTLVSEVRFATYKGKPSFPAARL